MPVYVDRNLQRLTLTPTRKTRRPPPSKLSPPIIPPILLSERRREDGKGQDDDEPEVSEPHGASSKAAGFNLGLRALVKQRLDERSGRWGTPVARAHYPPNELPTPIDEIRGGWAPYAVLLSRDLPAPVDQHRGRVTPGLHGALHHVRIFPEGDQQNLKPPALKVAIELVDGR